MKKSYFLSIIFLLFATNSVRSDNKEEVITIGTNYGGWTIPKNLLNKESICYLVGAGEDISFDLGVIKKYKCEVHTIDPTPRAQEHINYIKEQVSKNLPAFINNSSKTYNIQYPDLKLLTFIPVGLWHSNETLKFYVPRNPKHVSLSIDNLHNTKEYFELPCKRLSTLMQELGHSHITLLKLDIEGAECVVLDTIFKDNIDITCLCIEWDEMAHAQGKNRVASKQKMNKYIQELNKRGYKLIYKQDYANMTFLKK